MWAGADPDQAHIDKIKKKVADCVDQHRHVTIEKRRRRRYLCLHLCGRIHHTDYSDVKKIKWPPAAAKQLKVILGALALAGALVGVVALIGGFRG